MSKDKFVDTTMSQTDSASLCTLCVLETNENVFENFSSSLSLDLEMFSSSNNYETNSATSAEGRLNFIKNSVTAQNDYLRSDRGVFNKTGKDMKLDKNEIYDCTKSQPEKNNVSKSNTINGPHKTNNLTGIPKSCDNENKIFENKEFLGKLSSQNDEQNKIHQVQEQSEVFSFPGMSQSISYEIEILPKLSQTIIDQVINYVENDLIQNQRKITEPYKLNEPLDQQQQVSILKTSSIIVNNEKLVSIVNPSLEPIQNFQLRVINDENRLRRVQFYNAQDTKNVPFKETLKRDKNIDATETAIEVPKKKPKIITQEVLQSPVRHPVLIHRPLAMQHSREKMKNNDSHINTKDFEEVIKRLQISTGTAELGRRVIHTNNRNGDRSKKVGAENEIHLSSDQPQEKTRKVEEETNIAGNSQKANGIQTGESLQDHSKRSSPLLKKSIPRKLLNLSMLQRKIAENSKRLKNQVEEMERLSSFIDELRENFADERTEVNEASRTKRAKVKKEFVSRSTQTTNFHPSMIDVDGATSTIPIVVNGQKPNIESSEKKNNSQPSTKTETDMYVRNWFCPVELENDRDTVHQPVTNAHETMPKSVSSVPEKIDTQTSNNKILPKIVEDQQTSNPSVQYDPYYNPLRPRRWPRHRNNPSKFRTRNQSKWEDSFFPPLPIVITNRKSTNATK